MHRHAAGKKMREKGKATANLYGDEYKPLGFCDAEFIFITL